MKKLSLLLLIISFFISCNPNNNDQPGDNTTISEDKDFINAKITETLNCIDDIKNGEAIKALTSFLKLNAGNIGNETWIETMTTALENTALNNINIDESNNYRFNFTNFTGEYIWDRVNKRFNFLANATNIIIRFPSVPTQTTNNVVINFSKYTDRIYQANAENVYLPTAITVNITKDGAEIFKINYTGDYNTVDVPTPKNVNLTINMYPQTYTFNVSQLSPNEFSLGISMLAGTDCKTDINSTIRFVNSDFKNFDQNNDLSRLTLNIKKGDLNIVGTLDARALDGIEDPSTAQVNNAFSCNILRNTDKIGELKFKDVNDETRVYIFYKDFTSEDVTVFTDRFVNGLKIIFEPYFGENVYDWF